MAISRAKRSAKFLLLWLNTREIRPCPSPLPHPLPQLLFASPYLFLKFESRVLLAGGRIKRDTDAPWMPFVASVQAETWWMIRRVLAHFWALFEAMLFISLQFRCSIPFICVLSLSCLFFVFFLIFL